MLLFGHMFQTKSSSKSFLLQICCLEFPIPDIAKISYSRHKIFHFILSPQIFHICLPIQDNDGIVTSTAKYSFFCGNGTVFDQQATFKLSYFHTFMLSHFHTVIHTFDHQALVCNHADDAFPCEESPSLYGSVPFGEVLQDY